ncbi:MAG: alkaline phosphatase D family protein [Planctomycetota bacterium]|jgi:phosphodiesterase/alkaline phosphatase D-like protein
MLHRRTQIGVWGICISVYLFCSSTAAVAQLFHSTWPKEVQRTWVGPEYWANRLQDWRIANGRLECVEGRVEKPMRTVHLLTRRLGDKKGELFMSVRTGLIGGASKVSPDSATGFLIGAGSEVDYRAAALVHHSFGPGGGIIAAVEGTGRAVFRDMTAEGYAVLAAGKSVPESLPDEINLHLECKPAGGTYKLSLIASDPETGRVSSQATLENVDSARLAGNVALVSHPGSGKATGRFWFRDWKVYGSKVEVHGGRLCGPVLCAQYTLHNDILKITAQMMPLGPMDTRTVKLQTKQKGQWNTIAKTKIIVPGYTAPFRVEGWDSTKDTRYRVVYDLKQADGSTRKYSWFGTIRGEPVDKDTIVVAAFTGNYNVRPWGVGRWEFAWTKEGFWFPHNDIVKHVAKQKPDVLFFSGDQVYEGYSPTVAEKSPLDKAELDYLYKWYLWCWVFGKLARDIPCICIPDDHDVYHGNIWGAGGRPAKKPDDGGYVMPASWVNMIQRTQTSHLPDPYDPTPVEQGISVYYTSMNYGGVSFAIIEDRKWKSSPTAEIPEGKVVNGWFQNPDFDPVTQADVAGAKLLGNRQLNFLRDWSTDWSNSARMKVVLSQTLFSNVATLPKVATNDRGVPQLKIFAPGEYPPDDEPVADADSGGWPQTGRNKALREVRRGFALHIAGDQHLGSTIQYGIDDWNDAGFALCVPSIGNCWPRRWFPPQPGRNHKASMPAYTGEYRDGFGNLMTVHAVSNPVVSGHEPADLHNRAPGYGIVKFDKSERTIKIECWPRYADPTDPETGEQYPGWPITIKQADNYARKAAAWLPIVKVSGMADPVVQVIDEENSEIIYTLRIKGNSFRPKVFKAGAYTIKVGEPNTAKMKTLKGVQALAKDRGETVEVNF